MPHLKRCYRKVLLVDNTEAVVSLVGKTWFCMDVRALIPQNAVYRYFHISWIRFYRVLGLLCITSLFVGYFCGIAVVDTYNTKLRRTSTQRSAFVLFIFHFRTIQYAK